MNAPRESNNSQIRTDLAPSFTKQLVGVEPPGQLDPGLEAQALADTLLRDACQQRTTDIHIDPYGDGYRIRFRIDGELLDAATVSGAQGHRLANQFMAMSDLDPVIARIPRESRRTCAVNGQELDLRFALTPCIGGHKMAIRLLNPRQLLHRIDKLGLRRPQRERIEGWLAHLNGMCLITGPTGGGKTTTLYAFLHEMRLMNRSVVTIEDPVEYRIEGVTQVQVDEPHGLTFAAGLKTIHHLDPDYILVGEVRDRESAQAAVDAAVSGRALLSTLHSRDAVSTVTALRNWGVQDNEIAVTLAVVIAQRLVRTLCPECREQEPPTDGEAEWLRSMGCEAPRQVWHAVGCPSCLDLGYVGRTGIFEVWRLDETDYHLILHHTDEHAIRQRFAERDRSSLLTDALAKIERGVTSVEAVQAVPGLFPNRQREPRDIARAGS